MGIFLFTAILFLLAFAMDSFVAKKRVALSRVGNGIVKDDSVKIYLAVSCFAMFILLAFRAVSVGPDTASYVASFENLDPSKINFTSRDYAYSILCFILRQFTSNARIMLIVTSAFFPIAIFNLLKNEKTGCVSAFISLVVIMALGIFGFAFAGIRQTIALSFVIISFKYIKSDKLIKFLLCIFIAMMFHFSALIFIIAYPVRKFKVGWFHIVLLVGVFIFSILMPSAVITFIQRTFFGEIYYTYGTQYQSSNTYSMFFIQATMYIFCLFFYKQLRVDKENRYLINIAFFMLVFQVFTPSIAEFFRVAYYFSIFMCLLMPRAIHSIQNQKLKIWLGIAVVVVMIVYLIAFNNPLTEYAFVVL